MAILSKEEGTFTQQCVIAYKKKKGLRGLYFMKNICHTNHIGSKFKALQKQNM